MNTRVEDQKITTSSNEHAPKQSPNYEVEAYDGGYVVHVFMPGVDKNGLNITLREDILSIEGRRTAAVVPQSWRCIHQELSEHNYTLRLHLNIATDVESIKADMKDGVLSLRLPYAAADQRRAISIN